MNSKAKLTWSPIWAVAQTKNPTQTLSRSHRISHTLNSKAKLTWSSIWALERVTGIEPAPSVWKTEALPLSYTRGRTPNLRKRISHFGATHPFYGIDLLRLFGERKFATNKTSGMWRNLVAHLFWVQGVAGSNPVIPTKGSSESKNVAREAKPRALFIGDSS